MKKGSTGRDDAAGANMSPGQKRVRSAKGPSRTVEGSEEMERGSKFLGQLNLLKRALQKGDTLKVGECNQAICLLVFKESVGRRETDELSKEETATEVAHVGMLQSEERRGWSCHMGECHKPYHPLRKCPVFLRLAAAERKRRAETLGLCAGCLTIGHGVKLRKCPHKKELEDLCSVKRCRGKHHRLLHVELEEESGESPEHGFVGVPPSTLRWGENTLCGSGMAEKAPIQLMTQWIKNRDNGSCLVFWDLGSQVTLVTTQYAEEHRLQEMGRSSLRLSGLGSGPSIKATVKYKVPLLDTGGNVIEVVAHGLDHIASNLEAVDPRVLKEPFPEVPPGGIEGASGRVSLLMGQDNLRLFPVEARRHAGLALFRSRFGTGWVISGNASCPLGDMEEDKGNQEGQVMLALSTKHFQAMDFLSAEAMGTDLPRRCASCKNCKECQFRTSCISFKEDQEYQVILDGLKFDEDRCKWTASYPFFVPPTELSDNFQQVKRYTENMERRLIKQNRVEEFNKQFQDTVDRGVFRELQGEELQAWKGPVNYIAMVEAFKNGPHATTPLRICMNSSLKQPPPVKKSLNAA